MALAAAAAAMAILTCGAPRAAIEGNVNGSGNATIAEYSCSNYECMSGCVQTAEYSNNTCHPSTYKPGYMVQAYAAPVLSGLCFQMHTFSPGTCPGGKAGDIWGEGCNVCKQEYPNSWSIATGCESGENVTFHRSCTDAACNNCSDELVVSLNKCTEQKSGGSEIYAVGPFPCTREIVYKEYKGTDCNSDTPDFHNKMYDAGCYNFDGHAQAYNCSF